MPNTFFIISNMHRLPEALREHPEGPRIQLERAPIAQFYRCGNPTGPGRVRSGNKSVTLSDEPQVFLTPDPAPHRKQENQGRGIVSGAWRYVQDGISQRSLSENLNTQVFGGCYETRDI